MHFQARPPKKAKEGENDDIAVAQSVIAAQEVRIKQISQQVRDKCADIKVKSAEIEALKGEIATVCFVVPRCHCGFIVPLLLVTLIR